MIRLNRLFSVGACCLWATAIGWGQTAQIVGTITDSTGARVPQAKISAANVDTGTNRNIVSNPEGYYTIPLLPPGTYLITVMKEGFKPVSRSGVKLAVSDNATIDFTLQVGSVSEAVTVSGGAALVETQSGTIKRVVDQQRIVDLPLNGRDITQLLAVQAGVLETSQNGSAGNGFVVNGNRQTGVYFLLDGGMNTNSYQNFSGLFPNPDAIEEFSVQTSNFSAEYANSTGAVVSAVTKSGTNQFHGSAFEFVRNGAFNARNFFAAQTDSLKRNQFGGTVGGPILKNRLFFFFAYQDTKLRSNPQLTQVVVPTGAMRVGNFSSVTKPIVNPATGSAFPGNQIPVSMFSPVTEAFLKYLPDPGTVNGASLTGAPLINNQREYTARGDWLVGSHRISGRIFYTKLTQPFTGNLNNYTTMNGAGVAKSNQPYSQTTINDVYSHSSSFLNSFTFARRASELFNDWSSVKLPLNFQQAGVQNIAVQDPASVYIAVSGGFTARPGWQYDGTYADLQFADTATWVHGRHELKFGTEILRTTNSIENQFRTMGQFTFNGSISGNAMADFMLGDVYQFWQGGGEFKQFSEMRSGFFAQDNFRATPKLTLNLGLRWDPIFPPHDSLGRVECFGPGQQSTRFPNAPTGYLLAGDAGCPNGGFNTYWPGLAPRFGFAYRLGTKTVVRGGFGLFWSPLSAIQYNTFVDSAPFSPQVVNYGVNFQNPYAGTANPFPASFAPFVPAKDVSFQTPLGQFGVFNSGFQPSYTESFNFTVERQLMRDTAIRASYIGNNGRHLSYLLDLNYAQYLASSSTVANTQQRRPYQNFGSVLNALSVSNSSFNGLQLAIERRLRDSFSFEVNYTFSKSIDSNSQEATPGQGLSSIPGSMSANRGLSDFDVPHRIVASYVWALPKLRDRTALIRQAFGGWETTGIWTMQSGTPFTVTSGVDNSRSGLGIDHADVVSNPYLDTGRSRGSLVAQYFNTAAFTTNALGTFGSAPRNFIRGPGLFNADLGLVKPFYITEKINLQFRAEFFNTFNRPNLGNPNTTLGSALFGKITSAGSPRIGQFALKLNF